MKYFIIFSVFVVLIACKGKNENAYTLAIDSLSLVLKGSEKNLLSIDFEKADSVKKIIEKDVIFLRSYLSSKDQEKYNNLIINYSELSKFEASKSDSTVSKHINESSPKKMLSKQIEYSYNQLKNLKHDYLNNKLDENKSKQYLMDEKEGIDHLNNYIKNKQEYYIKNLQLFDSLKIQINQAIKDANPK